MIILSADQLNHISKSLSGLAREGGSLPILGCIQISNSSERSTFTASNLETTETITLPSLGNEAVDICLPAKQLKAISAATKSDITLATTGSNAIIKSGKARWQLPCLPGSDYPTPDAGSAPPQIIAIMPLVQLQAALHATLYAAGVNDVRSYLNSVYLNVTPGMIHVVATNGQILGKTALEIAATTPGEYLLPTGTVKELLTLQGENITLSGHPDRPNQLIMQVANTTITSALVDGSYPNWQRVIPNFSDLQKISVNRQALGQALASAALIHSDHSIAVVTLTHSDHLLRISSESGSSSSSDEVASDSPNPIDPIGLSVRNLTTTIASMSCENIDIYIGTAESSVIITPADDDNELHLVMPVKG